ncbi:tetratricopeptide repeat protein [Leptolyngbya sp. FACHB-671]|uniref:tetratricopeptide repeat protein n=1 Tax=Leptolyngbya sp. FACHB-671 TaxID=2692812 RepID=UPI0016879E79|nr:tetratricopeptide repeat protein [Leptolyngbya sp. FACHB-671]
MTDIPFRKILGLNQQTYQCLKLALSLNLRRQIFIAVCDDLTLRDRLAAQLLAELANPSPTALNRASETGGQRYPRLVTLDLSLSDPNPIVQVAQWLSQSPPPKTGNRRAPMPAFQFVGIEHLTRQSAAVQRLFLTHLQGIERSLPVLESSLLLWMPRPWFRSMPQSAPEFWRCRTGVFEFVGDPTPLPAASIPQPRTRPQEAIAATAAQADQAAPQKTVPAIAKTNGLPQSQATESESLWDALDRDLAKLDQANAAAPPVSRAKAPQPGPGDRPANSNGTGTAPHQPVSSPVAPTGRNQSPGATPSARPAQTAPTVPPRVAPPAQPPAAKTQPPAATPAPRQPVKSDAAVDQPAQARPPQVQTGSKPSQQPVVTTSTPKQGKLAESQARIQVPPGASEAVQPLPLLQQIELLHQQQAPPAVLANAYRTLGNLYRDRIEQGDASPQNLMIAIQAYEQVLLCLDETSNQWADILNDLGNLYWMLSRSPLSPDQALPYLQQGIQAYQLALTKVDPQAQPQTFPMIQNNLGAAYADLARYQEPAENLQRSVQAYQQALRYRKADVEPLRYASTQNNLGTTYWNLAQHQQPKVNLKQAIAAYSEALRYYNPKQEPLNYAMIQNNLGTAYWNLAQQEQPKDWLGLALGAYRMALKYRTLEVAPAAFAATQNNLGTAYWHMANHVKDDAEARLDYLEQAIAAYKATLIAAEKLAKSSQPIPLNFDLNATHNNLGLAHYQIASDPHVSAEAPARSNHLEASLHHHLQALQGWQQKPEFSQTALSCLLQTIRAFYNQFGIQGQNLALSKVPGHLLPQILPQL